VVATVSFLYLPLVAMRRRGEDFHDFGVTFRGWRQDLKLFLLLAAIVGPLYLGAYVGYAWVLGKLPAHWAQLLSPYPADWSFHLRLPARFDEWVVDQLFVVALPEEFFYRGFIQSRLRDAWPEGRVVLGARLGRAFWVTAVLFALGHLAIFEAWRLAVFFPALLFGWMRERTGTVVGSALFHAACNLYELVLAASFFGRV
jgi:membrane protease YdiL (CAAX protease family)